MVLVRWAVPQRAGKKAGSNYDMKCMECGWEVRFHGAVPNELVVEAFRHGQRRQAEMPLAPKEKHATDLAEMLSRSVEYRASRDSEGAARAAALRALDDEFQLSNIAHEVFISQGDTFRIQAVFIVALFKALDPALTPAEIRDDAERLRVAALDAIGRQKFGNTKRRWRHDATATGTVLANRSLLLKLVERITGKVCGADTPGRVAHERGPLDRHPPLAPLDMTPVSVTSLLRRRFPRVTQGPVSEAAHLSAWAERRLAEVVTEAAGTEPVVGGESVEHHRSSLLFTRLSSGFVPRIKTMFGE